MSDKEKPQKYVVFILRKDSQHLEALVTEKFNEAKTLYETLTEEWTKAIHEKTPFSLSTPVVTSFDPGLIYEITVRPMEEPLSTDDDNPYKKNMMSKGLSATRQFSHPVLDGGYQ